MNKESNFSYRFIHASDIHLGSHQYRNELRANDFIDTFREVLSLSLFYKVDFVILGGDIFNSREILPNHMNKIVNILKVFQKKSNLNIPIICIEGNHDIRKHMRGIKIRDDHNWLKFLNNLGLICLLDADFESNSNEIYTEYDFYEKSGGKISFKDVIVHGNRYLGNNFKSYFPKIYSGIKRNNKNSFNILIQHLGVEGQMINVPGVELKTLHPLNEKVDYLALGHFHKQFTINNWIFNPGSSEPVCSADFTYKRGIFLVNIFKSSKGEFSKTVRIIRLHNRPYQYEMIYVNRYYVEQKNFYLFIINQLKQRIKSSFRYKKKEVKPVLLLHLRGIKPAKNCRNKSKNLRKLICNNLPFIDVRIYEKFKEPIKSLENYVS